ncbi:MAG: aminotransferase class IV [Bacteroidia bacterium]|nr:aminotransferase class IV [Bacteroidia bacterium]
MINFNGTLVSEEESKITTHNRGLNYGDAAFETLKYSGGKVLFWEDHYFRLMATMRIMRMEIPMRFTPEYLENQILELVSANGLNSESARIKLLVVRTADGLYKPENQDVEFYIWAKPLEKAYYEIKPDEYVVDLYKDYYIAPGLLSNLKSNNKLINVIGSIYAEEQGLSNCLLLNTNKMVIESLNSNLFLVFGNKVKTPPLSDGCLKGVMRKQIMDILDSMEDFELIEESVSPFELQKADEMFLTNVISGIIPVSQYRKKAYSKDLSKVLTEALNTKIRD